MNNNKCCGTRKFHIPEAENDFQCDNEDSEGYGLITDYKDLCSEYEERED